MANIRPHMAIKFKRRSGKIVTILEGLGTAMLEFWALQNTGKTEDTVIFDKETGEVKDYFTGNGDFPKVEKKNLGNIEDYAHGILALVNTVK
jgi:hypothetical protein